MKLGTRGRYAVMAILDLALHEKKGPVSLSSISERQNISLSYLEQIFNKLRRKDIVSSTRGAGGGYSLSRGANAIYIADVIQAVDEPMRATRCEPNSQKGCMLNGAKCLTHHLWADLGDQIISYLKSVSLEDALKRGQHKNTGKVYSLMYEGTNA